jgi:hypothetical protein
MEFNKDFDVGGSSVLFTTEDRKKSDITLRDELESIRRSE